MDMRGMKIKMTAGKPWMRPAMAITAAMLASAAMQACGVGSEIDRPAQSVSGIRVDSLKILPSGSRFILRDSAVRIRMGKFYPGYACSEILALGLDSIAAGSPPAYAPLTRVRLPASAECAVDTLGRDSVLTRVFREQAGWIRLANSSGTITDSAQVVPGSISRDSLIGKFSADTHTFSQGAYTVVDSSVQAQRSLYADSLVCGQSLNQAEYATHGDSLRVRLTVVTLDSAARPDTCRGHTHPETITIRKAP
jgi:hypothetical protein